MDTILLTSLRQPYKHFYEGKVTASKGEKKYVLPFTFSDESGVLRFERTPELTFTQRQEIFERTTDLVMDRIVGFDF